MCTWERLKVALVWRLDRVGVKGLRFPLLPAPMISHFTNYLDEGEIILEKYMCLDLSRSCLFVKEIDY